MKKIILSAFVLCFLASSAQEVTVSKPRSLLKGVETEAYNPILSSDGGKMLFSGKNSKGLKLYSFADDVTVTVADASTTVIDPTFASNDEVFYVTKNIGSKSVKNFNVKSGNLTTIIDSQRGIKSLQSVKNGIAVKDANGIKRTSKDKSPYVYTDKSNVVICIDGVEKSYSPVKSHAGYLWASLSPDATKVLFFAAGKGIVIMSIEGEVISQLGNYERPVWFGNDYIVAQNAKDDGHQYSSSQILLLKADGSFVKELTTPTSMTMHPSATSPEIGKIVYDTVDGLLYEINVTIK